MVEMKKQKYRHPVICLCRTCGGKGYTEEFPEGDFFRLQDPQRTLCPQCQGSGRVIVSSETVVTVVAYLPEVL